MSTSVATQATNWKSADVCDQLVAVALAAELTGDAPRSLGAHGRLWWSCRLDLASAGCVAIQRDVTLIALTLAALELDTTYEMSNLELLMVVLEPISFNRRRVSIGAPLAHTAEVSGLSASIVVTIPLISRLLTEVASVQLAWGEG